MDRCHTICGKQKRSQDQNMEHHNKSERKPNSKHQEKVRTNPNHQHN